MDKETKIMKEGTRTPSGGTIHKGTNYVMTAEGMQAIASINPAALKSMGIDVPSMGDGKAVYNAMHNLGYMGIQDKQVYQDPLGFGYGMEIDSRPELKERIDAQMKAMATTTGGAGTAGYAMVPIYVDPRVVDTTRKFTPLVELTPRVANMGTTADYNKLTAKGSASYQAEDTSKTEADDTYDRASSAIKYGYAVGRVTGPMIAAMPPYTVQGFTPAGTGAGGGSGFGAGAAPSAKQLEVLVKTRALRELQENTIINGSISSNAYEYDGVVQLMGSTNTVDKNTSAMTLEDLRTAIRYAFDDGGRPNLAVCSSSVYTDLEALMMDQFRYTPTVELPWGFETLSLRTMVGQMPVIPSMYLSNTAGSKAIYFLDMSVTEMRVLQDLTYEELAKTSDAEKFMIKVYETLIIKNTAFCSSITEIA